MKSVLLIYFLVLFSVCSGTTNNIFNFDESKIESELATLNELEDYVVKYDMNQLSALLKENPALFKGISLQPALGPDEGFLNIQKMDWRAFTWGFCCWPGGILAIIFNESTGPQSRLSYFYGIGTAFALIIPAFYFFPLPTF
jgi:hypothetical protein